MNRTVYPVVIVSDRYGGAYSGALWTAFNKDEVPDGCQSDDISCAEFWGNYEGRVGKGRTPDEAYASLDAQTPNSEKV